MTLSPAVALDGVLSLHVRERPDAVFLLCPQTDRTLTFHQLALAARRIIVAPRMADNRPGDKIALLLPGGFDTVTLSLSLMLTGYVPVPLNLLAADEALGWIIAHSGVGKIITCADYSERLQRVLSVMPVAKRPVILVRETDLPPVGGAEMTPVADNATVSAAGSPAWQPEAGVALPGGSPRLTSETPALLIYTSGTTGKPKGVLLTHGNLLAAAGEIIRWHRLTPQDRLLCALPLYHINGQVIGTLASFIAGGSLVAPPRFSVSEWWSTVARYRCTWLNLVPTMIAFLLNGAAPIRCPGVKFARSASAPLSVAQHRQFEQQFGIPVIEGMGMTESGSLAFCNPHDNQVHGSIGLPCGVEAAVIDADGRQLADDQDGEIILRGPNIMSGYYRNQDQTAAVIDGQGWLHSGDRGHRDARGFYFITGRMKEIIIKGGENIAPKEIDEALAEYPAIREAAAFAIPDADYGQNIAAALVLNNGDLLDEAGLRVWCRQRLGTYKVPVRFIVVEALPRGGSGKVQRLALCAQFGR